MTENSNGTGNKSKLFAKVAQVMTEVRRLKKDGENTYDKYKYISGDNAFEHIGGIMASVNLVILPSVYEIETKEVQSKSGGIMYFTTVHAQITLADGETGETWTGEWFGEGSDRGDKSINKAMTSMMKYFLLRVFQIGSGEDADADSPGNEEKKTTVSVQRPQQTPTKPAIAHTARDQAQAPKQINVAPAEPPTRIDVQGQDDFDRALNEIVADDEKLATTFHATGSKTFGADWNNGARKWLITEYTRAKTPNDIRSSSKELINSERQGLIDDMTKNGKSRVAKYAQSLKAQTLIAQTHGHMVAEAA